MLLSILCSPSPFNVLINLSFIKVRFIGRAEASSESQAGNDVFPPLQTHNRPSIEEMKGGDKEPRLTDASTSCCSFYGASALFLSQSLETALKYCNYVFTFTFVIEASLKLVAFGFRRFFKDRYPGDALGRFLTLRL